MASVHLLGIDCGGTHTDGALLRVNPNGKSVELICSAKVSTRHDNLPATVLELIELLRNSPEARMALEDLDRITLGTTLEVNSLIEDKADKVGLALSAGPGLKPEHFVIGSHYCIVPGGLDHRGVEVGRLDLAGLARAAEKWPGEGVKAVACVGKFSPRNPAHEIEMARVSRDYSRLPVSMGHSLSGRLDFPRRIATTYYNAAVSRLHSEFLDSMENAFKQAGLSSQYRLLKADGGAVPFPLSRRQAVQSILSGPAASVMGALATWPAAQTGCSLLFDIGGTTTDIALFYEGSPILDRNGMYLLGHHTLIRSLASISIGIGGDSLLQGHMDGSTPVIQVGPQRVGPAMAFGGLKPTLLDALNTLDGANEEDRGNQEASLRGMRDFTASLGFSSEQSYKIAGLCVLQALDKIRDSSSNLIDKINSRPIYTLAGLKTVPKAFPEKACVVGGPAKCIRARLENCLGMPVELGPYAEVANAIGAGLARPTASLEIYADTGKGELSAPALDLVEHISRHFSLEQVKDRASRLLEDKLLSDGINDASVEVVEEDIFATLDDHGRGAKDMRVTVQAKPGIVASLEKFV